MRLYDDLAYLWPIISPPAEYRSDAACGRKSSWHAWTRRVWVLAGAPVSWSWLRRRPSVSHLTSQFDTEAVDLSPKMLELSRSLNNNTVHHLGDMRDIRLGRRFDVVAIYDAVNICWTKTTCGRR